MNVYEELLAFVERETELIHSGKWNELVELERERSAILAKLPKDPPAEVHRLLEVVLARLKHNAAALSASLAQTRGELDRVGRARTALGSYAGSSTRLEFRG